jgi:hypothetical protein
VYRLYIDGTTQSEFIKEFKNLDLALGFCIEHGVSYKGVIVFNDSVCVFNGRNFK